MSFEMLDTICKKSIRKSCSFSIELSQCQRHELKPINIINKSKLYFTISSLYGVNRAVFYVSEPLSEKNIKPARCYEVITSQTNNISYPRRELEIKRTRLKKNNYSLLKKTVSKCLCTADYVILMKTCTHQTLIYRLVAVNKSVVKGYLIFFGSW